MYCGSAVDTDTGESMLVEFVRILKYMYPELPLTNVIGYIMNSGLYCISLSGYECC